MLEFLYGLGWLVLICGGGWLLWWFRFGRHEKAANLQPAGGVSQRTVLDEVRPQVREVIGSHSFNSPAPRTIPASSAPAPVVDEPLSMRTTWERMMGAVHLLIVGETGAGKSTAANALLSGRAGKDLVCVIDPHDTPDAWGGIPAIGAGRDYAAIDQALRSLLKEMNERYQQLAVGRKDFEPLTIFLDELPSIMKHCPAAKQFFGEILREGRKADMRLVCLTQSTRVKTLGIEGEGDVLENLTWLLLGEKAISATKDAAALDYPAALEHKGKVQAVMTTALPGLASARVLPSRVWKPSTVSTDDQWLSDQLEPLPTETDTEVRRLAASIDRTGTMASENATFERAAPTGVPVRDAVATSEIAHQDAEKPVKSDLPQDDLSLAIRALVQAGLSRNKTIDLLHISGNKNAGLKRIKQALGEEND